MKIIPAVDIRNGKCAQLVGGAPGTEKFYGDPLNVAKKWVSMGAEMLHLIDLDAALGQGENYEKIAQIREKTKVPIELGGGIRDLESCERALDTGIDRIILGTLVFEDYKNNFKILRKLGEKYGTGRVIVSVDSKDGLVVIKGWQSATGMEPDKFIEKFTDDFIKKFNSKLIWGFLFTNVDVEGQMKGINLDIIEKVVSSSSLPVIVSGGISSTGDLREIKKTGAFGVVIGKALYEGKIDVKGFKMM